MELLSTPLPAPPSLGLWGQARRTKAAAGGPRDKAGAEFRTEF